MFKINIKMKLNKTTKMMIIKQIYVVNNPFKQLKMTMIKMDRVVNKTIINREITNILIMNR